MAGLVDHRGRPIDTGTLRGERAGPSVTGVRSIWPTSHLHNLTPKRIASILREAEVPGDGASERYVELAEIMEERDLHYLGVMQTRRRQVAQIGVRIEPASDNVQDIADADLVREFFSRDPIEDELFDLLDAISKGYSVAEIIWDMSERQWRPARIDWRQPRWFDFDRDSGTQLMRRDDSGGWVELEPYKFIVHISKAKSGLALRGGLARAAAWAWLFKNYTIKDWMRFAEAYGQPLRIGKFGPGAKDADKQVLYKAVANIASDAAAIIPDDMSIEFISDTTVRGRSEIYRDLITYIDRQISIAVLGQTLTTDAGDSGSYALGQVHNLVRRDIERSDARQLAATLRRDLVIPIVALNHGVRKDYPKVIIERDEPTDTKMLAETLDKLVPLGLRVRSTEVRAKLGLEEPDADDEVLSGPTAPVATPPLPGIATRRRDALLSLANAKAQTPDRLEQALDAIDAQDWDALASPMIQPILDQARGDPEGLMGDIASLYPELDTNAVQQQLAQILFAADTWERIRHQADDDNA